ncbi:histone H1 [Pikeienuella piscinae]|uniref:Histone H1 n=1 Tax=Pikeienuella piscinae TaxID=2748098 RepID=A0A7L5BTJ8_9RHOB|nr:histone H1 [Pikeienuella piscinae]QIE54772.1 histone H1 [Pikeienuella piscinae]QIE57583.1 histone H1 [Pikeienuella piscinae]
MTQRPKRPADANQLAKLVADIATGEDAIHDPDTSAQRKGGKKGGEARAASLTPQQREEIARVAAEARWKKG